MERNAISTKEAKMLNNRDFSQSNREYIKKNKLPIIIVCLILVLGLICGIAFGFNGNFEFKGYNEFSVLVQDVSKSQISKYENKFETIVNERGGKVEDITIEGEGSNTKLVINYKTTLKSEKQTEINQEIAKILQIEESQIPEYISAHIYVSPVVKNLDYIYTAATILILLVVSTIFAYFRYDGACAISTILSCLLGSLVFVSFATIFRLTIGLSYFAMLVILNLLIIYCNFQIFENIRETSWLQSKEYSTALTNALKSTRTRIMFITIGLMVIGLAFVLIAPTSIKFVAINVLFMAVAILFAVWYVLPFFWSMFITHTNIRRFKTKTKSEIEKPKD